MKRIALALSLVALAGCAYLKDFHSPFAAGGSTSFSDSGHPDWLRDPAQGDYPYSPKGW